MHPLRSRVVVVGSVNFDLFSYVAALPMPGETVMGTDVRSGIGGKGANQALAAKDAGADVALIGCVGEDEAGNVIRGRLKTWGVDISKLQVIPGLATGTAHITVDAAGQNTIVVATGANAAVADALAKATIAGADAVVTQGELPRAAIESVGRLAAQVGSRFVLNLAPYQALDADTIALADPLIVNEIEASNVATALAGRPGSLNGPREAADLASALAGSIARSIVITLGAAGAVGADADGAFHVSAGHTAVVDTTGAGDALVGALVAVLASTGDLRAALRAGVAAGTVAVSQAGGTPLDQPRLRK